MKKNHNGEIQIYLRTWASVEVPYVNILLKDEFTVITERDIFTLDRKIFEYQAVLDAVPEYDGYKRPA